MLLALLLAVAAGRRWRRGAGTPITLGAIVAIVVGSLGWATWVTATSPTWAYFSTLSRAWELGIKSLYYLRSKSIQRAGFAGGVEADNTPELREIQVTTTTDYDECLACQ